MKTKILTTITSTVLAAGIIGYSQPIQANSAIVLQGNFTVINENTVNSSYALGPVTSVENAIGQYGATSAVNIIFTTPLILNYTNGILVGPLTFYDFPTLTDFIKIPCTGGFGGGCTNVNDPNSVVTVKKVYGVRAEEDAFSPGAVLNKDNLTGNYALGSTLLNALLLNPNGSTKRGEVVFTLQNINNEKNYSIVIGDFNGPQGPADVPEMSNNLGLISLGLLGFILKTKKRN